MLCGSSIYVLKEQYHSFKLGSCEKHYFIHALFRQSSRSRKEYPVQLFPFRHHPDFVWTRIIDTDSSGMTEIPFETARDLLSQREGPFRDFSVVDNWDRRMITGVDINSRMRIVINENIGRRIRLGPISPERLRSITGYNMRRNGDGWDLRHFCFRDIYQEYFEWKDPLYDYIPYAVQQGPDQVLMEILEIDGFTSFACCSNYVALVNLELKRVTTAQAPVKHKCVDDRVYQFEEFMDDVYMPWKKAMKTMREAKND